MGSAILGAEASWPQSPSEVTRQADVSGVGTAQVSPPGLGLSRWINPATAPFIPVPVIGVDPNSGTTLGILPTWVHTDEQEEITRIIAPDFIHNPDFGYGVHGRVFAYPSENEQWSVVAGIQQRVQQVFDAEYATELSRKRRWSINYSLIYNRDGTPRFFGIGNRTVLSAETNYTRSQQLGQIQVGFNVNHDWQLLYTFRPQRVDVEPGTLAGIAMLTSRFPNIYGTGVNDAILNRIAVVYDSRDNLAVPHQGMEWVLYEGAAGRNGVFNDSLYSESGIDARSYWPVSSKAILAAHVSLRYMSSAGRVPFWALSSIGGDTDAIGGEQALRGFGEGRFYDRDSLSGTVEWRRTVISFDTAATHIDVEFTPFVDVGRVFAQTSTIPVTHLHKVGGIGFRGVARPFVVGYVDIGYGGEGVAAFTGINYPF
jgi:Omp85 superfamily domain